MPELATARPSLVDVAPTVPFAPKVINPDQFARIVGTAPNRVRKYVKEGRVRAIRHGRRIVIPLSEVDRFLESESEGRQ